MRGKLRVVFPLRATVLALLPLLVLALTVPAMARPSLTSARIGHYGEATRLVFDLTAETNFRIFTLATPNRVVIDLPPIDWALDSRAVSVGRGLVSTLRFGQYRPEVSRIVLDLTGPVAVRGAQVTPATGAQAAAYRFVLDLVPVSQDVFLASVGAPAEAENSHSEQSSAPAPTAKPAVQSGAVNGVARVTPVDPLPQPRQKPTVPKAEGPWLIALDPGHGGRDPGAMGSTGIAEKHFALTFARELRTILEATGRYRVVMTRNRDRYIALRKRVAIARDANADLFLSIHADRLKDKRVSGASVYTLSDKASDAEAGELAARENKSDIVADVDLSEGYDQEVAQILISLVQQNTMNCSATFANLLLPELGKTTKLLGRSHRFAGFRVLKAPDIPSVLVELGFLSNPRDAERLASKKHRAKLARAIVAALDAYFPERC